MSLQAAIFNPKTVSYEQLLRMFLSMFPPEQLKRPSNYNDNYRLAVFYHNEAQEHAAEEVLSEIKKKVGGELTVELSAAKDFFPAEDYHQRFYEKLKSQ